VIGFNLKLSCPTMPIPEIHDTRKEVAPSTSKKHGIVDVADDKAGSITLPQ